METSSSESVVLQQRRSSRHGRALSREILPLLLVERHRAKAEGTEQQLPDELILPSPSINKDEIVSSPTPAASWGGNPQRSMSFGEDRGTGERKALHYEFHSPSELLEDPWSLTEKSSTSAAASIHGRDDCEPDITNLPPLPDSPVEQRITDKETVTAKPHSGYYSRGILSTDESDDQLDPKNLPPLPDSRASSMPSSPTHQRIFERDMVSTKPSYEYAFSSKDGLRDEFDPKSLPPLPDSYPSSPIQGRFKEHGASRGDDEHIPDSLSSSWDRIDGSDVEDIPAKQDKRAIPAAAATVVAERGLGHDKGKSVTGPSSNRRMQLPGRFDDEAEKISRVSSTKRSKLKEETPPLSDFEVHLPGEFDRCKGDESLVSRRSVEKGEDSPPVDVHLPGAFQQSELGQQEAQSRAGAIETHLEGARSMPSVGEPNAEEFAVMSSSSKKDKKKEKKDKKKKERALAQQQPYDTSAEPEHIGGENELPTADTEAITPAREEENTTTSKKAKRDKKKKRKSVDFDESARESGEVLDEQQPFKSFGHSQSAVEQEVQEDTAITAADAEDTGFAETVEPTSSPRDENFTTISVRDNKNSKKRQKQRDREIEKAQAEAEAPEDDVPLASVSEVRELDDEPTTPAISSGGFAALEDMRKESDVDEWSSKKMSKKEKRNQKKKKRLGLAYDEEEKERMASKENVPEGEACQTISGVQSRDISEEKENTTMRETPFEELAFFERHGHSDAQEGKKSEDDYEMSNSLRQSVRDSSASIIPDITTKEDTRRSSTSIAADENAEDTRELTEERAPMALSKKDRKKMKKDKKKAKREAQEGDETDETPQREREVVDEQPLPEEEVVSHPVGGTAAHYYDSNVALGPSLSDMEKEMPRQRRRHYSPSPSDYGLTSAHPEHGELDLSTAAMTRIYESAERHAEGEDSERFPADTAPIEEELPRETKEPAAMIHAPDESEPFAIMSGKDKKKSKKRQEKLEKARAEAEVPQESTDQEIRAALEPSESLHKVRELDEPVSSGGFAALGDESNIRKEESVDEWSTKMSKKEKRNQKKKKRLGLAYDEEEEERMASKENVPAFEGDSEAYQTISGAQSRDIAEDKTAVEESPYREREYFEEHRSGKTWKEDYSAHEAIPPTPGISTKHESGKSAFTAVDENADGTRELTEESVPAALSKKDKKKMKKDKKKAKRDVQEDDELDKMSQKERDVVDEQPLPEEEGVSHPVGGTAAAYYDTNTAFGHDQAELPKRRRRHVSPSPSDYGLSSAHPEHDQLELTTTTTTGNKELSEEAEVPTSTSVERRVRASTKSSSRDLPPVDLEAGRKEEEEPRESPVNPLAPRRQSIFGGPFGEVEPISPPRTPIMTAALRAKGGSGEDRAVLPSVEPLKGSKTRGKRQDSKEMMPKSARREMEKQQVGQLANQTHQQAVAKTTQPPPLSTTIVYDETVASSSSQDPLAALDKGKRPIRGDMTDVYVSVCYLW